MYVPPEPGIAAPSSAHTRPSARASRAPTIHPTIGWGPATAATMSGMVTKGPMPHICVMLTATASRRPRERTNRPDARSSSPIVRVLTGRQSRRRTLELGEREDESCGKIDRGLVANVVADVVFVEKLVGGPLGEGIVFRRSRKIAVDQGSERRRPPRDRSGNRDMRGLPERMMQLARPRRSGADEKAETERILAEQPVKLAPGNRIASRSAAQSARGQTGGCRAQGLRNRTVAKGWQRIAKRGAGPGRRPSRGGDGRREGFQLTRQLGSLRRAGAENACRLEKRQPIDRSPADWSSRNGL